MKAMSGEEAEAFPHKNVVVRALGLAPQVFVDVVVEEYQVGDLYLLCSDGLCDMIDDDTILATITRFQSIDTVSQTLVQQANEAGGVDNITALVVRIEPA
jgi:protein phosphatase